MKIANSLGAQMENEYKTIVNGLSSHIFNEDCKETIERIPKKSINLILTSPFYNTNDKCEGKYNLSNIKLSKDKYPYVRYDVFIDSMTNEEYVDYTVDLFNQFDEMLCENGCILYNLNYGARNTECMFMTISGIIANTPFTIGDVICWKKKSGLPINTSPNKLTRIWEPVYVICRKNELKTFHANKELTKVRPSGQKYYKTYMNFIEAKNNDGACPYNKATYSSDLCLRLLELYGVKGGTVYDPFIGSGTTAVAALKYGMNCIGSEISENQCVYAQNRLKEEFVNV